MISGSVAVEGQGRSLSQVLGQPAPVPEFLRPLPRAAPYSRYPHQPPHIPQPSLPRHVLHLTPTCLRDVIGEEPSSVSTYPPVPRAYSRPEPIPFPPYFGAYPTPAPAPLPPPPPPPPSVPVAQSLTPRSPPRGKEGSLKHRLLSRAATPGKFSRGALIQLGGGQFRRVEDMRTEDFVMSAEQSPELRLANSTVIRLLRRPATDSVTLTLSYNGNRSQVDMETPVEHPFFVYGSGWASCSPERTLQCYGLQVSRLQVGDVCVSLMKRETPLPAIASTPQLGPPPPPPPLPPHSYTHHQPASATIVTTATTTAMTVRPADAPQSYPENLSLREDSRKRRWSAPDICDEKNSQRPRTMHH